VEEDEKGEREVELGYYFRFLAKRILRKVLCLTSVDPDGLTWEI
jgi:hypothetical protein